MTIQEIRELIQVVIESGVAELEVSRGDNRVRIRRSSAAPVQEFVVPAYAPPPAAAPANPQAAPAPALMTPPPVEVAEANLVLVKSPIVGTFYEAPAPGAPPFVRVGDTVHPGKVLCIIESMKLMNEIEAEISGVMVARLVENGHPVEYGEAMFSIRPL